MTEKDLAPYVDLVNKEREADDNRRRAESDAAKWTRVRDQFRDALGLVMGAADTGIIDGKIVMRKVDTAQFAKARFAKAHPDIWEAIKVPKLTYEADLVKLAEIDKDLVAEFSTTRWYNDTVEEA